MMLHGTVTKITPKQGSPLPITVDVRLSDGRDTTVTECMMGTLAVGDDVDLQLCNGVRGAQLFIAWGGKRTLPTKCVTYPVRCPTELSCTSIAVQYQMPDGRGVAVTQHGCYPPGLEQLRDKAAYWLCRFLNDAGDTQGHIRPEGDADRAFHAAHAHAVRQLGYRAPRSTSKFS
jgi:hypothetical protein